MYVPSPYPVALCHSPMDSYPCPCPMWHLSVRAHSQAEQNQPILTSWAGTIVNIPIIFPMKEKNFCPPLNLCKLVWVSNWAGWIQISKSFIFYLKSNPQSHVEKSTWHGLLFMTERCLGDICLLERNALRSQELNAASTASPPLLCSLTLLCPWTVDYMGSGGREEDNTFIFLKSALFWLWEPKTMNIRASPYSKSSMNHVLWTWKSQLRLPKAWNHLSNGQ